MILLCNYALPEDGSVWPKTCRNWCMITLLWFWQIVRICWFTWW